MGGGFIVNPRLQATVKLTRKRRFTPDRAFNAMGNAARVFRGYNSRLDSADKNRAAVVAAFVQAAAADDFNFELLNAGKLQPNVKLRK
jgi:hypothetical protein